MIPQFAGSTWQTFLGEVGFSSSQRGRYQWVIKVKSNKDRKDKVHGLKILAGVMMCPQGSHVKPFRCDVGRIVVNITA
jgi:hypothetical protein